MIKTVKKSEVKVSLKFFIHYVTEKKMHEKWLLLEQY
jgi:hypothetical protein